MNKTIFITIITLLMTSSFGAGAAFSQKLNRKLRSYVNGIIDEFHQIPEDRKQSLNEIGDYIVSEELTGETAKVLFICTHNSRRSHFGQIWLQTAAAYYGVSDIATSSGGTEATAFNPRAVESLRRAGFDIDKHPNPEGNNPQYLVNVGKGIPSILTYSKKYSDPYNPQSDFAAVMVCSDADQSCPVVDGADARFAIPYDDPRYFDDTPAETEKYDERCRQIAREMFFLMDYVKNQLILQEEQKR